MMKMMRYFNNIRPLRVVSLFIVLQLLFAGMAFSQPVLPARTFTVSATQGLHFGTFCLQNIGSSGGTVTVDYDGSRTSTGEVMLLSAAPESREAIYEINLCQGRSVIMTYPATAILAGNNGGYMTLNIGPTEKGPSGTTFEGNTNCGFITQIHIGGTLVIGSNAANPGGTYTGSFNIIFNQQ
jgi:hypothetical protein